MTDSKTPRLCGGTYFTLVLESRGQLKGARKRYEGEEDPLNELNVLLDLSRIVTSDKDVPNPNKSKIKTLRGNTAEFKACINFGGGYFLLGDKVARKTFDSRIKNDYATALAAMCKFVTTFIDVNGSMNKDVLLVEALLDLIDKDTTIEDNQLFYVCEDGHPMTKSQLRVETRFCLDAFLLGVWHYALLRPEGIEIGQETFNEWCPSQGHRRRSYQGSMGEELDREIRTFRHKTTKAEQDKTADDKDSENAIKAEFVDKSEQSSGPESERQKTKQDANGPHIFQFNQYGNNNTQIGFVKNFYGSPKEDNSDQ